MRRLLEITTGRHPYQVLVAVTGPLCALAITITGSTPVSLSRALPHPYTEFWLALLAIGGCVTLIGAYGRGELDNMLIVEAGGVALFSSMISIYVGALFIVAGTGAATAGGFMGALALAGWWRVGQIIRDVRKVWAALAAGITPPPPPDPGRPPGGGK